jgi:hypothetical protein
MDKVGGMLPISTASSPLNIQTSPALRANFKPDGKGGGGRCRTIGTHPPGSRSFFWLQPVARATGQLNDGELIVTEALRRSGLGRGSSAHVAYLKVR